MEVNKIKTADGKSICPFNGDVCSWKCGLAMDDCESDGPLCAIAALAVTIGQFREDHYDEYDD